jgi:two-component system CheB/CheR fusion protein
MLIKSRAPEPAEPVKMVEDLSALQLVESILKQSDTPPCVIIDGAGNIIYLHGRTGRFLEPPIGRISVNILEMARPGLKMELTGAIQAAASENKQIVRKGIAFEHDSGQITLDLTVKPLIGHTTLRGLIMVVFKEIGAADKGQDDQTPIRKKKKNRDVEMLEEELWHTRENLEATINELATSNEELQSTNEELQSTNEELETSKEELQSLNEEAATVNAELQSRIDELSTTNDDMKNLLDSTQIATIFLDLELGVRRFTPKAVEIIPLSGIDLGRSIKHFATTLINTDLASYALDVIENLGMREKEVQSKNATYYRMRVRPYRTTNNVIDGVVITFEDITALKKTEAALNELNAKLALTKNQQALPAEDDSKPVIK